MTVDRIDLEGRSDITKLPEGVKVTEWVDIGGTSIDPKTVPEEVPIFG